MSAPLSSAATRDPAPDIDASVSEDVVAERWSARWKRLLLSAPARSAAVLGARISLLLRLRKRPAETQSADEDPGNSRPGQGERATRSIHDIAPALKKAASLEALESLGSPELPQPPKPRRWLRVLVYLGVTLGGAMGGAALAYILFAQQLQRQSVEIQRQAAAILESSQLVAESGKKLDELQAKQAEAEKRRETIVAAHVEAPQRQDRGTGGGAGKSSRADPGKAGDCALNSGNFGSALKRCIEDFNRR